MSFLKEISSLELWEAFLEREEGKEDLQDKKTIRTIKSIINSKEYLTYNIDYFNNFPIPLKRELTKYNTSKRRIVYVYPWRHRIVLKAVGFYILTHYNDKFALNSLAYTWNRGVKSAFYKIKQFKIASKDTIYKNDFSDYFNSINLDILETKLNSFLTDEDCLISIIMKLLKEDKVNFKNNIISISNKGVMAGTPIAGILANIYMHDVDMYMLKHHYKYLRYADDTLIIGEKALEAFKEQLALLDINFNSKKEEIFNITTGLTFLGFTYINDTIKISDEARDKMKSRMKRRAKWYRQWMLRKKVPKHIVLRHYIKGINEKLYSKQSDTVDWTQWYLPAITDIDALRYLDKYYIICIRYLDSGTWHRGKKFYNLQYSDIKKLGYRSLVNTYYKIKTQNRAKFGAHN